jgi:hypothetical protein
MNEQREMLEQTNGNIEAIEQTNRSDRSNGRIAHIYRYIKKRFSSEPAQTIETEVNKVYSWNES